MAPLTPQQAGLAIVRSLIEKHGFSNGFTTADMFKLAVQQVSPAPFTPHKNTFPSLPQKPAVPIFTRKARLKQGKLAVDVIDNYPPHPEHPIRSIRFLKKQVLQILAENNEIKMTRLPNAKALAAQGAVGDKKLRLTASQVDWMWKPVPEDQRVQPPPAPKPKTVVGTEVGVGLDLSHLNNRRQDARVGKVSRAVTQMKSYKEFTKARDSFFGRVGENPELIMRLEKKYADHLCETNEPYSLAELMEKAEQFSKFEKPIKVMSKMTDEMKEKYERSLHLLKRYTSYRNQPQAPRRYPA